MRHDSGDLVSRQMPYAGYHIEAGGWREHWPQWVHGNNKSQRYRAGVR
jgi:hypothetical protein